MPLLIELTEYPVYKRGATVDSEDLNKANELTVAALNELHGSVDVIIQEYEQGNFTGTIYTPYYEDGSLKWRDNKGHIGLYPFYLHQAVFTPSVAADGTLSWTNNLNLANPAPVNIKGPTGSAVDELPWTSLTGRPTTISGYGITDAYTKAEVDAKIDILNATISELNTKITNLTAVVNAKMNNTRLTVSTSNPTGGVDGDVWVKVV